LTVEQLRPADLAIPARNVRRQEEAHIRDVAAAIAALGFCDPVLIGSDGTVIDGTTRVEAAKRLGLPLVPCIRVGHLNSAGQSLLRLASNRLAEKGAWNLADAVGANRSAWIGRPAGDGHAENAPLIERARPNQQRTNP